jgi:hypothetical protein
MDLRAICSARHLASLREFVRRVGNLDGLEHHWLLQVSPPAWRADDVVATARLRALVAGLALA